MLGGQGGTRAAWDTGAPLARSRRSGRGWGRWTGAEERCGELGFEVGWRSCGLGRDPSAVDGDGDEKGKGLEARRRHQGSSSARGAAPRLSPIPPSPLVSAPLKVWHRISPQDLAIALQTLRFVWFSCSKFTLFFSFLEGEKKAGSAWKSGIPTRGCAVGRAAPTGLGQARRMERGARYRPSCSYFPAGLILTPTRTPAPHSPFCVPIAPRAPHLSNTGRIPGVPLRSRASCSPLSS